MRKELIVVALCCLVLSAAQAHAAGVLDAAVKQANAASWGARQDAVRRSAPSKPIMGNQAIQMAVGKLAGRDATVNYLFDKAGGLYNIAWYVVTPVDNFETARELDATLERDLRARYGEPSYAFSDGDAAEAEKVKAVPPGERPTMEKFRAASTPERKAEAKKLAAWVEAKQRGEDAPLPVLDKDVVRDMGNMPKPPHIFYSKLLFWDTGKMYAYINFLCSTDGTCYQHLQFVSKERTKKDGYDPTFKPFGNTPADRDQDLVTEVHSAWVKGGGKTR